MRVIFALDEIQNAVEAVIPKLNAQPVVSIDGEMGAGKTTLTAALCKALGAETPASSPTFSIINEYKTTDRKSIFHMDLYRLKDEQEAIMAGVEDALYSGNICLVEWPEKAPGLFPENTLRCRLSLEPDGRRCLHINS